MRRFGGVLFVLALLVALSTGAAEASDQGGQGGGERGPEIGSVPPDFTLPAVGGGEVTLSELRDQPVVLVFFRGSW